MTAHSGGEDIRGQAQDWLMRLQAEEVSAPERLRFENWMQTDPRHREAFQRSASVWRDLGRLTHLSDHASLPERSLAGQLGYTVRTLGESRTAVSAVVGCLIVPLCLGSYLWLGREVSTSPVYATGVAEVRDVTLQDGTAVTLGARTTLNVRMLRGERRIFLKGGAAFFSVKPDPSRPFVVVAGGTRVRVLGTQFEVRQNAEWVKVAVLEGVVEIVQEDGVRRVAANERRPDARFVSQGQQVVVRGAGLPAVVEDIRLEAVADWRKGRLSYDNAPLSEVVADLNSYSPRRLSIGNEALRTRTVTASFRSDQTSQMIDDLAAVLGIEADRSRPGEIVLR